MYPLCTLDLPMAEQFAVDDVVTGNRKATYTTDTETEIAELKQI